jgi:hypothetical protein
MEENLRLNILLTTADIEQAVTELSNAKRNESWSTTPENRPQAEYLE